MIVKIKEVKDLSDCLDNKYSLFIINARHEYFISNLLSNLKNSDYNVVRISDKNKIREELESLQFFQLVTMKRKASVIDAKLLNKKNLEYVLDNFLKFKYENILVLTNTDFKLKKNLSKIKVVNNHEKICYIDLSYPTRKFVYQLIEIYLYSRDRKLENSELSRILVNRLADSYDNYPANLDYLVDISEDIITKEMVMEAVTDYSNYSLDSFYSSLIKLDKKQVPFKSLADLLDNREPISVMYGLENFIQYIYQAKYLKVRGVLMNNDFIDKQKDYFGGREDLYLPKKTSIFRQSNKKVNFYLELSDSLTLEEIIYIQGIISSTWRSGKAGNKYVEKQDLYSLVMKILDRRNLL